MDGEEKRENRKGKGKDEFADGRGEWKKGRGKVSK